MGTGASRRKLIKAKINLFSVEYRVTEKRGGSLSIFAVLTARTLYTYKYEVANNNDKVHRSASAFLSLESSWNDTFCRPPVWVAPVRCSLGEAHLSGRPTGTLPMSGVPGLWRRRTPGRVGGAPAAGSAEHGGSSCPIRILVFRFFSRILGSFE